LSSGGSTLPPPARLPHAQAYRHFRSKDEIASDLFLSIHRQLTNLVAAAAGEIETLGFEGTVAGLVRRYCALADGDWTLFSFHLLQLHRFLHLWDRSGDDLLSATARLIEDGVRRGAIPDGDAELRAGLVLGILAQVAENRAYGRLKGALGDHSDAFTRAMLAVLKAG
jgi:AcrR family transcriptional regulator